MSIWSDLLDWIYVIGGFADILEKPSDRKPTKKERNREDGSQKIAVLLGIIFLIGFALYFGYRILN